MNSAQSTEQKISSFFISFAAKILKMVPTGIMFFRSHAGSAPWQISLLLSAEDQSHGEPVKHHANKRNKIKPTRLLHVLNLLKFACGTTLKMLRIFLRKHYYYKCY